MCHTLWQITNLYLVGDTKKAAGIWNTFMLCYIPRSTLNPEYLANHKSLPCYINPGSNASKSWTTLWHTQGPVSHLSSIKSSKIFIMGVVSYTLWHPSYIGYFFPDSKVHGANMGTTWVLSAPDGPHVGPMDLAIRVINNIDMRLEHR